MTLDCLDRYPHERSAFSTEADYLYCASVRGIYGYYATSVVPEELIVQTILLNGPSCANVRRRNGRYVDWGPKARVRLRGSTDYPVKTPGPICRAELTALLAGRTNTKAAYMGTGDYLFARKFDYGTCPAA
jgi:hypothetical protein